MTRALIVLYSLALSTAVIGGLDRIELAAFAFAAFAILIFWLAEKHEARR